MKVLSILGLLWSAVLPHDFYSSILTIHHKAGAATLDLTWRMTAHDIEHAFSDRVELKLGSPKEHPKADSLLNDYLNKHLVLMQDAQLHCTWMGKELEGENLFCYLQVAGVKSAKDLMVQNTLLQEVFGDQQNIVHVEEEGRSSMSHTFIRGSAPYVFTW